MQNMSNPTIKVVAAFFLMHAMGAHATKCDLNSDNSAPKSSNSEQTSNMCAIDTRGNLREVQLIFDLKKVKLHLKNNATKLLLEDIGKDSNPAQVGAGGHIRFLPPRLQAYRNHGYLLFISSRRSTHGSGSGQCGSGTEDYLNVLDINAALTRIKARYLIGSCIDDIEVADFDQFREFKSFWVENEQLNIQFLNYDARCEDKLRAVLDSDFRKLRFTTSRSKKLQE